MALATMVATVMAVPAKRGQWRTITLTDGTQVKVELKGDEHIHFWQTEDGRCFTEQENGMFAAADMTMLKAEAAQRQQLRAQRRAGQPRRTPIGQEHDPIIGKKKGIIILVEFSNKEFLDAHDQPLFDRIANEENYKEGRFYGSVHDYFSAQSNGQFDLTFDVVGPVLMDTTYQYYGKDVGGRGYDAHPGELTAKACIAVQDEVDFKDYDWDGDGEVDQVFILYAGKGQADGGDSSTIWPHEWQLDASDYRSKLELDDVLINTYACGSELNGSGQIDGIGTICHEFSHCLGFPDLYDINDGGNFGMGSWDLMDGGCYNGNGYIPAGYSSYEKWFAGWLTPKPLTDTEVTVDRLTAQSSHGDAYIIRNPDFKNEYYILENRQRELWDSRLPGEGLLIHHVDYDSDLWGSNIVNTTSGQYAYFNNHERCTIIMANNNRRDPSGHAYPYGENNSLTSETTPKGFWYNDLSDASEKFKCSVVDITRNGDGTVAFTYLPDPDARTGVITGDGELLFHETFDRCEGIGGNDNIWSGEAGDGRFSSDYNGWDGQYKYGANQCVKIGTSSNQGNIFSPLMKADGTYVLTFKAAPWGTTWQQMEFSVINENGVPLAKETTAVMPRKAWTEYQLEFEAHDIVKLRFTTTRFQFFLDDVKVVLKDAPTTPTGVHELSADASLSSQNSRPVVYTLSGQRVMTPVDQLPRGIYLINGRRVIIK